MAMRHRQLHRKQPQSRRAVAGPLHTAGRGLLLLLLQALLACTGPAAGPGSDDTTGADAAASDGQVADTQADSALADGTLQDGSAADTSAADGVDGGVTDASDGSDTGGNDTGGSDDAGDAGSEIAKDCPGGPFCPCQTDTDCDSGKCLETADGLACAPACAEAGCPAGFVCKTLGGNDPLAYCVAAHLSLCAPCQTNKDCQAQGVSSALCLDYGTAGHFCGGACSNDSDCGSGYACVGTTDPLGASVLQCKAKAGICGCSAWAKTAGTLTTCSQVNGAGSCSGTRSCGASGLQPCSAATPAAEVCNNQDDNCDGTADNLPADATCAVSAWSDGGSGTACSQDSDCSAPGETCNLAKGSCRVWIGTCVGQRVCSGGVEFCQGAKTPKAEACNGEDDDCDGQTDEGFGWTDPLDGTAKPVGATCGSGACAGGQVQCLTLLSATCSTASLGGPETCNGVDDDCDGQTDEATCDDSSPCTVDACTPGGGCSHTATCGACDDGDPCSSGDTCASGTCVGSPKSCDDGSPCTADSCDPASGVCIYANQTASCSDGDACTSGDSCGAISGGGWGCIAGAAIGCDDANPCTDDACDPAQGCTFTSNGYVQPCYEGPPATEGVGLCHGGVRACQAGVLAATCADQVLPMPAEACNGLDDSCDGFTDEGCAAASVALSFAAAQTTGKSGGVTLSAAWAPDRPAAVLQDQGLPQRVALGLLAWFARLVAGN